MFWSQSSTSKDIKLWKCVKFHSESMKQVTLTDELAGMLTRRHERIHAKLEMKNWVSLTLFVGPRPFLLFNSLSESLSFVFVHKTMVQS